MRIRFLSLLLPLFAACATTTDGGTPADADRGGLGKADLVGSCEHKKKDLCGTKGTGNCWCDDACVEFGDCCSDADDVCGIEAPAPEGDPCGGHLGLACEEGEFCFYIEEHMCGAADHLGECVVQPGVCTKEYLPVCGCDGQTYGNACMAAASGTSVASQGECEPTPQCCDPAENPGGIEGAWCCADGHWQGDIGNGDPGVCDPFGGLGQVCEEVDTCGPIVQDYQDELAEIRACESDDECGQVLVGTSCGCTRNLVARIDADLADLEEIRAKAELNECSLGGISTCDCPPADGFVCDGGFCGWNYTQN